MFVITLYKRSVSLDFTRGVRVSPANCPSSGAQVQYVLVSIKPNMLFTDRNIVKLQVGMLNVKTWCGSSSANSMCWVETVD